MDNPFKSIDSMAQMITKTTSVMTPLLIINLLATILSGMIFWLTGMNNLWVFLPLLILVIYTVYRYERFANKSPHMLSNTEVQQLGMRLGAGMGEKNEEFGEANIDELPSMIDVAPELPASTRRRGGNNE